MSQKIPNRTVARVLKEATTQVLRTDKLLKKLRTQGTSKGK